MLNNIKMFIPNHVLTAIDDFAHDGGYENADNYRAYQIGDKEMETLFNELEASGCCGSYKGKMVIGDVEWIIGFNYGH